MSLLESHLEQISFSCQGIDSLPFPRPKIFTNALLSNHDITSLIRDTEAHERALFSVPPPPPPQIVVPKKEAAAEPAKPSTKRRQTVFNVAGGEVTTGPPSSRRPRQHTAVAAVLGGDLHAQISGRRSSAQDGAKGDVDVEVLLMGAEKLCTVYPQPRAMDRIPALRQELAHQNETEAYYEARVAEQNEALGRMNKDHLFHDDDDEEEEEEQAHQGDVWTDEELRREEEEVRELERKKRALQERLRDLSEDAKGLDESEPRWS